MKLMGKIFLVILLTVDVSTVVAVAVEQDKGWTVEDYVVEKILDNGMIICVVERHDTPLAFCNIYYNVGSVREHPGITGLSHLLEHMMFKGTRVLGVNDFEGDNQLNLEINALKTKIYHECFWKFDADETKIAAWEEKVRDLLAKEKDYIIKDEYWATALEAGASFVNASTSNDKTGYYLTLPAHKFELQMLMEADRMENAQFREFYTEKEVVREERRLSENRPGFLFGEQLVASFFSASPYSWHVLGWDIDLQKVTHDDIRSYYERFYRPNNAMAVYIGDLEPDKVFEKAVTYFGQVERGPDIEPVRTREPSQQYEKIVRDMNAQTNEIRLLYHIPGIGHEDIPALDVLAEILSSKESVLQKVLVDTEKLISRYSIYSDAMFFDGDMDCKFYGPDTMSTEIETLVPKITAVIEEMKKEPPTEYQVTKARNNIRGNFMRSLRHPWMITGYLVDYQFATGDWRNLQKYLDALEQVTPDEVLHVLKKYLVSSNRTVGIQQKPVVDNSRIAS